MFTILQNPKLCKLHLEMDQSINQLPGSKTLFALEKVCTLHGHKWLTGFDEAVGNIGEEPY